MSYSDFLKEPIICPKCGRRATRMVSTGDNTRLCQAQVKRPDRKWGETRLIYCNIEMVPLK